MQSKDCKCSQIASLLLALMMIITLAICLYIVFSYKTRNETKVERVPLKSSVEKMHDDFINILKKEACPSGA